MQAEQEKFSDFLAGDKTFVIPVYQRNYDWTEKNCKRLFEDLERLTDRKNKEHFIGVFVYKKKPVDDIFEEYIVIDGQQRITSIILFARALCEFVDENLKRNLTSKFL